MDYDVKNRSNKKSGLTAVYYAKMEDIVTIAEIGPTFTTQASKVSIYDNHTFATDDGFRVMYVDKEKSKLTWEGLGERGSGTGKCVLSCFIPGNRAAVAAMIADNPEMMFLTQLNPCQSGEYQQVGTKCDGAKIVPGSTNWTTGLINGSEVMGWTVTFECYQDSPIYYWGDLTLAND